MAPVDGKDMEMEAAHSLQQQSTACITNLIQQEAAAPMVAQQQMELEAVSTAHDMYTDMSPKLCRKHLAQWRPRSRDRVPGSAEA